MPPTHGPSATWIAGLSSHFSTCFALAKISSSAGAGRARTAAAEVRFVISENARDWKSKVSLLLYKPSRRSNPPSPRNPLSFAPAHRQNVAPPPCIRLGWAAALVISFVDRPDVSRSCSARPAIPFESPRGRLYAARTARRSRHSRASDRARRAPRARHSRHRQGKDRAAIDRAPRDGSRHLQARCRQLSDHRAGPAGPADAAARGRPLERSLFERQQAAGRSVGPPLHLSQPERAAGLRVRSLLARPDRPAGRRKDAPIKTKRPRPRARPRARKKRDRHAAGGGRPGPPRRRRPRGGPR